MFIIVLYINIMVFLLVLLGNIKFVTYYLHDMINNFRIEHCEQSFTVICNLY